MPHSVLRPRVRFLSGHVRKRLAMQTWALSLPVRFPLLRSTAARSRVAARDRRQAGRAPGQVMCLRLSGQLCAGTTGALLDAVVARIGAAMPPVAAVVLDLSDTPDVDDGARAGLLSLCGLLAQSHTRLRLVLPEAATCLALGSDDAASTAGLDALHTTVRAALLAAHAALPGPALVTPALRTLLENPPELLLLPPPRHPGSPSGPTSYLTKSPGPGRRCTRGRACCGRRRSARPSAGRPGARRC